MCLLFWRIYFAERTFGIKAKPARASCARSGILPKEHLESRQSNGGSWAGSPAILPKEHLESRQSNRLTGRQRPGILPKEHLESRQSEHPCFRAWCFHFAERTFGIKAKPWRPNSFGALAFCRKNIWNQGKALRRKLPAMPRFCRKNIWNQGKASVLSPFMQSSFCRKNIWNQGKALTPEQLWRAGILPKEHLESRQSSNASAEYIPRFCRKNIWNQGKASTVIIRRLLRFCRKNIWNQGKALGLTNGSVEYFAERTFGIKAKLKPAQ